MFSEIAELLNMNQSAISHQLRFLKNSKLVNNRREGKTIYYSLADDHVYNIISQGIEHVEEDDWGREYHVLILLIVIQLFVGSFDELFNAVALIAC